MLDKTVKHSFDHYWNDRDFLITLASMCFKGEIVKNMRLTEDKEVFNEIVRDNLDILINLGYNDPILKEYKRIQAFSENVAVIISYDNKYGYIKKDGTILLKPEHYHARPFYNGYGIFYNQDKTEYGVVTTDGNIVYIPCYNLDYFYNNVAIYEIRKHNDDSSYYGLIDNTGQVIVQPINYNIKYCGDDVYIASRQDPLHTYNDHYLINSKGKLLTQNISGLYIGNFVDGIARVRTISDKLFGYIKKDGTFLIKPQFDDAHDFNGGIACATKQSEFGIHYYQIHLTNEPYTLKITHIGHFTKKQPYRKITVTIE